MGVIKTRNKEHKNKYLTERTRNILSDLGKVTNRAARTGKYKELSPNTDYEAEAKNHPATYYLKIGRGASRLYSNRERPNQSEPSYKRNLKHFTEALPYQRRPNLPKSINLKMSGEKMNPFENLEAIAKSGVRNIGAIVGSICRKKYGAHKCGEWSAEGRKRKKEHKHKTSALGGGKRSEKLKREIEEREKAIGSSFHGRYQLLPPGKARGSSETKYEKVFSTHTPKRMSEKTAARITKKSTKPRKQYQEEEE